MRHLSEAPHEVQARFRAAVRDLNKKIRRFNLDFECELDPETYSFTIRGDVYHFQSSVKGMRSIKMRVRDGQPHVVAVQGLVLARRKKS